MPELPEVETVRRGLDAHVVGRRIASAELRGTRVARRHAPGADDLAARIAGNRVAAARRRGKYLWLVLEAPDGHEQALLVHLGMSGQLLVQPAEAPDEKHLHARFVFVDGGAELRFVDQRTFGGVALAEVGEGGIPVAIAHIAPDPLEPAFDERAVVARMRQRGSAVKRCLLDQGLVSGIGNIYADEALWRAAVHGERSADRLTRPALHRLLGHASTVMREALEQGGTSFDALYVDVDGASGYFARSLDAYGREGRPCRRCGAPIRREAFMNRSSFSCPRCQPRPRLARPAPGRTLWRGPDRQKSAD
ncbi:MAG: bifunctional DNA-formamidopyrimidine glycosylase/DNA-(apurinic or apyrimidinic site) lyase [Lapillicoccus sp.]